MKTYDRYIRYNKTSFFKFQDEIFVKGQYKYAPRKLQSIINDIIKQNISTDELNKLRNVYTPEYFQIAIQTGLDELLQDYYICSENGKFISADGQYINFSRNMNIDPSMYLRIFIYPIIASIRMKY